LKSSRWGPIITQDEAHVTTESGTRDSVRRWKDDEVRRVGVAVCTAELTAVGYTYCLQAQRLLDVLNKGLDDGAARSQASVRVVVGKDFIPLTEARIVFRTGEQRYVASTNIRKSSILFVAEISGGQPEATSVRDLLKVTKKPVATEVHVPPYHLSGRMHAEIWEQLVDHLESHDRFLPLTDVAVMPKLVNVESKFDFVAVNKDRVVYIGEPSAASSEAPPVVAKPRKKRSGLRRLTDIRPDKGS